MLLICPCCFILHDPSFNLPFHSADCNTGMKIFNKKSANPDMDSRIKIQCYAISSIAYTLKTTHCYISFIRSYFLLPKPTWLSPRPISDSQLHMLPCFHLCPIYLVVFKGSYSCDGISHLEGGFTLRCLQRLSRPDLATLPWS